MNLEVYHSTFCVLACIKFFFVGFVRHDVYAVIRVHTVYLGANRSNRYAQTIRLSQQQKKKKIVNLCSDCLVVNLYLVTLLNYKRVL